MNDLDEAKFRTEFRDLGVDRVRKELLLRRWPKEKLSVAREWVETADAEAWDNRAPHTGGTRRLGWSTKWFAGIVIAFGVLYAGVRLFERMF